AFSSTTSDWNRSLRKLIAWSSSSALGNAADLENNGSLRSLSMYRTIRFSRSYRSRSPMRVRRADFPGLSITHTICGDACSKKKEGSTSPPSFQAVEPLYGCRQRIVAVRLDRRLSG